MNSRDIRGIGALFDKITVHARIGCSLMVPTVAAAVLEDSPDFVLLWVEHVVATNTANYQ